MRKLFISADMEGCAAVAAAQALGPDRWMWEWTAARRWMTDDVVATSEVAFSSGYDEVIVADGHGNAHNIDPDSLPENARLVRSWPRPMLQMEGVEDPDVDACAFIGYHAAANQSGSILAHSFSGAAFRSVMLNDQICSEGYLNGALAGEFGKPVVFVSGDEHTVKDAQRYAPEAAYFIAKKSVGWRSQVSLPPKHVRRLMKEALAGALNRTHAIPFVVRAPYYLELEMTTQLAAEMLAYLPNIERRGAFSVGAEFKSVAAVVRFVAFAMLYSPTGTPAL